MNTEYEPGYSQAVERPWEAVEAAAGGEATPERVADELATGAEEQAEDAFARALAEDTTAPESPTAYQIQYPVELGELDADAAQADAESRAWMQSAGLSVREGSALSQAVISAAGRWSRMTAGEREQAKEQAVQALEAAWGPRTDELLDLARGLVKRLDRAHNGAVSRFLEETGAGADAQVVARLAHHAERLKLRRSA